NGGYCREGASRCRDGKCRTCVSVRNNLRAAVTRARHAGMTDAEIRAAKPQKRCGTCRQTLSSDQFPVDRTQADGLQSRCRRCVGETQKRTILPESRRAADARRRARKAAATVEDFSDGEMIAHWISQ